MPYPIPFDPVHDAALLAAAGYECRHYAEFWEDVGSPESGPKLIGHPAFDSWERPNGDGSFHALIVVGEAIVDEEQCPPEPEGLAGQF